MGIHYSPDLSMLLTQAQGRKGITMSYINVTDPPYRAVGNGTVDDTIAIQSAIDAASALNGGKGGIVNFPSGTYLISATLWIKTGVRLIGEGTGAHTQNGSGDPLMGTTILWSSTASTPASTPMIRIKSDPLPDKDDANQMHGYVYHADVLDLQLNGNDTAYIGVWMSGACRCHFRGKIRQVKQAGIWMDKNSTYPDTNTDNFNKGQSIENFIEELEFIYGSVSAVQNADGIYIAYGTQTKIGKLYGLTRHGHLLRMKSHDNGQFEAIHSALDQALTAGGGAIYCEPKAQVNLAVYVSGRIRIEDGATGNRVLHYNTEDGGIYPIPSTSHPNFHATLVDANNFHAHETHKFRLYDEVQFNAIEFIEFNHGPVASVDNGVPIVQYTSGSSLRFCAARIPRCQIYKGWIVQAFIYGYAQTNTTGDVNWDVYLGTSPQDTNVVGGFVHFTPTITVGSMDYRILKKTPIAISSPINFSLDGMLWVTVARSSDSYLGNYALLGVTLVLHGTGPENTGSYYVPAL